MGFLDVPVNIVTLILPTFLMAVGNAYVTHVVTFHRDAMRASADPGEASRYAIGHIGIPVLVTALTTVLGAYRHHF